MTTFSFKSRTRFGTWNIRTLLEPSRLAQICKEFKKYNLLFLGLCETRWPDNGRITTADNITFLYSGKPSGLPRASGVGFLLTKEAMNALITWQPHSDRIISIRLRTRARNITCIQCYAPTEVSETKDKEDFYSLLDRTIKTTPSGDILILTGDFNAQVGADNNNVETVMGSHGLGRMNENGELFTGMCANNGLTIGGTIFPHRDVHKVTWVSPDHRTETQIDHIAISRKWRGSLLDVRNRRGADGASDHHLLVGEIRLKISAIRRKETQSLPRRYDVAKLKSTHVRESYIDSLRTRYEGVPNNSRRQWKEIDHIFSESAKQHLGYPDRKRKVWISDNTWKLIEDRSLLKGAINAARTRASKSCLQGQYTTLDRLIKRCARQDKRVWTENKASEAQAAADTHRTRDLHRIAKQITGNVSTTTHHLKDPEGGITSSRERQLAIWSDYYADILSIPQPTTVWQCHCASHEVRTDISTACPDDTEIANAIRSMKNNKAPGVDNINPELLKADPTLSASIIRPIIEDFWSSHSLPNELSEGVIIKLPKRGNLTECRNWRGITLLTVIHKVLATILHARLSSSIAADLRNEQAGFRPHRSCTDHINSLRIIVEQSVEWRSPLYLVFIDFAKAFDTLHHQAIWHALQCKGIPPELIDRIKALYQNSTSRVLHERLLSNPIGVTTGVRQGCILSPLLFNIVLDSVMQEATRYRRGITWGINGRLEDLDYADDICLLGHNHSDIAAKLEQVHQLASNVGLHINIGKTKVLRINTDNPSKFTVNNVELEDVQSFCYLGSIISTTGGSHEDIANRIKKANQSFGALQKIWKSPQIHLKTKLRLFSSNVKSTLLYGCESWNCTGGDIQSLQAFCNRCLRKILKIFWPNVISNRDLWERTDETPIRNEIAKRKWSWIGHVMRRPQNDISRMAIDWNPQGSRRRGRPANTWRRLLETEIKETGLTWSEIKLMTQDRPRWKIFVTALCSNLEP